MMPSISGILAVNVRWIARLNLFVHSFIHTDLHSVNALGSFYCCSFLHRGRYGPLNFGLFVSQNSH